MRSGIVIMLNHMLAILELSRLDRLLEKRRTLSRVVLLLRVLENVWELKLA